MDVIKLIEYNTWANRLLTAQIASLPQSLFEKPLGGSFGSLKAVLIHLLESDWLWLNRWKGIPLAEIPNWQLDSGEAVDKTWTVIQDEMLIVTRQLAPDKNIDFVTRKGIPYTLPLAEIVTHLTHHGSYHRGQLTHMLREAGEKPVSTDYFIFCVR